MVLEFSGEIIEWRGPAPFLFVAVPPEGCEAIREVAPMVTYGWGVIPAELEIGATRAKTSLFPRKGGYLVPIKVLFQRSEQIGLGDIVTLKLYLEVQNR